MNELERLKDWIEESNLQLEINQVLEMVNNTDKDCQNGGLF